MNHVITSGDSLIERVRIQEIRCNDLNLVEEIVPVCFLERSQFGRVARVSHCPSDIVGAIVQEVKADLRSDVACNACNKNFLSRFHLIKISFHDLN